MDIKSLKSVKTTVLYLNTKTKEACEIHFTWNLAGQSSFNSYIDLVQR